MCVGGCYECECVWLCVCVLLFFECVCGGGERKTERVESGIQILLSEERGRDLSFRLMAFLLIILEQKSPVSSEAF